MIASRASLTAVMIAWAGPRDRSARRLTERTPVHCGNPYRVCGVQYSCFECARRAVVIHRVDNIVCDRLRVGDAIIHLLLAQSPTHFARSSPTMRDSVPVLDQLRDSSTKPLFRNNRLLNTEHAPNRMQLTDSVMGSITRQDGIAQCYKRLVTGHLIDQLNSGFPPSLRPSRTSAHPLGSSTSESKLLCRSLQLRDSLRI